MSDPEREARPAALPDEFALIDRLTALLPGIADRVDVVVGIGDDAAVLDHGGPELLVATTDAQVAGTHFRADWLAPEDVGWRALAVNASDVAAMGGRPHTALVSLVLPSGMELAWLEGMYRGLAEAARAWGVAMVGGNVSRAVGGDARGHAGAAEVGEGDLPPTCDRAPLAGLVIDVAVLGAVARDRVLTRAGAHPGDRVLVVGALGGAAAGRHLLAGDAQADALDAATREALVSRWRRPRARITAARAIAATALASAMIDVSDGFAADLGHLCDASGAGVCIEAARLPLAAGVEAVAAALGGRRDGEGRGDDSDDAPVGTAGVGGARRSAALALALGGGEDYALLLTAPPQAVPALVEALPSGALADVGEVLSAAAGRTLVDADGRARPLPAAGWRHIG